MGQRRARLGRSRRLGAAFPGGAGSSEQPRPATRGRRRGTGARVAESFIGPRTRGPRACSAGSGARAAPRGSRARASPSAAIRVGRSGAGSASAIAAVVTPVSIRTVRAPTALPACTSVSASPIITARDRSAPTSVAPASRRCGPGLPMVTRGRPGRGLDRRDDRPGARAGSRARSGTSGRGWWRRATRRRGRSRRRRRSGGR